MADAPADLVARATAAGRPLFLTADQAQKISTLATKTADQLRHDDDFAGLVGQLVATLMAVTKTRAVFAVPLPQLAQALFGVVVPAAARRD